MKYSNNSNSVVKNVLPDILLEYLDVEPLVIKLFVDIDLLNHLSKILDCDKNGLSMFYHLNDDLTIDIKIHVIFNQIVLFEDLIDACIEGYPIEPTAYSIKGDVVIFCDFTSDFFMYVIKNSIKTIKL